MYVRLIFMGGRKFLDQTTGDRNNIIYYKFFIRSHLIYDGRFHFKKINRALQTIFFPFSGVSCCRLEMIWKKSEICRRHINIWRFQVQSCSWKKRIIISVLLFLCIFKGWWPPECLSLSMNNILNEFALKMLSDEVLSAKRQIYFSL